MEEEIRKYWNNEFIRYRIIELEEYGFQEDTVEFLSTVGLMNGERFTRQNYFRFLAEFKKETIYEDRYIKIASRSWETDGLYIKLGEDHLYYIHLPNQYDGFTKELCNTRINDFVMFETIMSMIEPKYPNVDDDELEGYQCAREVIEEFKKVDPAAVYPYSYWANRMLNFAIDYFFDEDDKIEFAIRSGRYVSKNEAYFDVLFNGMEVLEVDPS